MGRDVAILFDRGRSRPSSTLSRHVRLGIRAHLHTRFLIKLKPWLACLDDSWRASVGGLKSSESLSFYPGSAAVKSSLRAVERSCGAVITSLDSTNRISSTPQLRYGPRTMRARTIEGPQSKDTRSDCQHAGSIANLDLTPVPSWNASKSSYRRGDSRASRPGAQADAWARCPRWALYVSSEWTVCACVLRCFVLASSA